MVDDAIITSKPYAGWRTRFRTPIYRLSLGLIDLAPDRSEYPSIYELADEPSPDERRTRTTDSQN
jgi:hypothetical protein